MPDSRLSTKLTRRSTGLSIRALNALSRVGCSAVGDVLRVVLEDLELVRDCGPATTKEIFRYIEKLKIDLLSEQESDARAGLSLRLVDGKWTIEGRETLSAIDAVSALRLAAETIESVAAMTPEEIARRAAMLASALESAISDGAEIDQETRSRVTGWCRWMGEQYAIFKRLPR